MKYFSCLVGLVFMATTMGSENGFSDDSPPNLALLLTVTSLKCTFTEGVIWDWENEEWHHEEIKEDDPLIFHFDSIDIRKGKARGIGNKMAVGLHVLRSLNGINFIETTKTGNIITTTVYSNQIRKREFPAVHSRHISAVWPLPSQRLGTCKIFD